MGRQRIRGASCVSALLRNLANGIEQGDVHSGDEKLAVARSVVAVVDTSPATGELLIVVCGVGQATSSRQDEPEVERELAYAAI